MNSEVVNPEMIILARDSRGMNQRDLADKLGQSVSNVSRLENSSVNVSPQILESIAAATGYPTSFFYQREEVIPDNLSYRRRDVVAQKLLAPINAKMNVIRQHVQMLTRTLQVKLPELPSITIDADTTAQEAARLLRKAWEIKRPIIDDLTTLIEKAGIAIATFDFNTPRVDSRSILTADKFPIIVYNKSHLGDRQRFSLAYELGHLVMHTFTDLTADRNISREANQFAAEFLMPEHDIRADFEEPLSVVRLAELKRKWRVSMIAVLYRADDLGLLTANQKKWLLQQFNNQNIRRREPVELDIPIEHPRLLRRWIADFRAARGLSTAELAAALKVTTADFLELYA